MGKPKLIRSDDPSHTISHPARATGQMQPSPAKRLSPETPSNASGCFCDPAQPPRTAVGKKTQPFGSSRVELKESETTIQLTTLDTPIDSLSAFRRTICNHAIRPPRMNPTPSKPQRATEPPRSAAWSAGTGTQEGPGNKMPTERSVRSPHRAAASIIRIAYSQLVRERLLRVGSGKTAGPGRRSRSQP